MRLISLHVENFGKLQQLDERFNAGLNVRLQSNGWGKSTLAVFIKAMLYGLPATTRRSLIENERKRYAPWQGGAYGGSLDIEVDGKEYRIERLFGTKEAEDTLSVTDLQTGSPADTDWAESPGERLFGVDIAAYERTTYLSQRPDDMTEHGMDRVHTKLNRLMDATDDLANYDTAMVALERRRQYYRHLRGDGGAIAEGEAALLALDRALERTEAAEDAAEAAKARLADIKRDIENNNQALAALRDQQARLHRSREVQAVAARLDALRTEEREEREQIETLRASLGGTVPTEQAVEQLHRALREQDEARLRLETAGIDAREVQELEQLRSQLAQQTPTEQDMQQLRMAAEEYNRLTVAAIAADPHFVADGSSQKTHEQTLADRRLALEQGQQSYDSMLAEKEILRARLTRKGAYTLLLIMLALSVALTVVGIQWPVLLAIGGGLLGVSLVLLLVCIARRSARMRDDEAALVGINHDLSHTEQRLKGARASLIAAESGVRFASLWNAVAPGAPCPEGLDAPLRAERLIAQYDRLCALMAKRQAVTEQGTAGGEALRLAKQRVRELVATFPGAPEDEGQVLGWLTEQRGRLIDCATRYERKRQEIAALIEQYDTESEQFRATFAQSKEGMPNEQALHAEQQQLLEQSKTLSEQRLRTEQQLSELAAVIDERDAHESERARRALQLEEQKNNLDAILMAEKYLKLARESLSGRYLATMKERFAHYMSLISGKDAPIFTMDGQFRVKLREGGVARNTEAFSVGVRDLISLCERLSLLDAMFEGERPFLILDDPFTNLDEQTVARANELLQSVAQQYQILYLTCHPSRLPQ